MDEQTFWLWIFFFYSEAEKACSEVWHDRRWFKMMRCRISNFKSSSPTKLLKVRARNLILCLNTYWVLFTNLKYWGFSLFWFVFNNIMNAEWGVNERIWVTVLGENARLGLRSLTSPALSSNHWLTLFFVCPCFELHCLIYPLTLNYYFLWGVS